MQARPSVLRIGLLQDRRVTGGTGSGGKIQVWRVEMATDTAGSWGDEYSCIRDTPVQKGSHTSLGDLRTLVRSRLGGALVLCIKPTSSLPVLQTPVLYYEIRYLSHPIVPVLAGRVCEGV